MAAICTNLTPTISIIVPVYNTGIFLRECIDSILNQTYENFELILIDDGSTDNSVEICMSYKRKDGRVRVIKQENSGVSVARNRGIDFALGRFILFVDSDDFLLPNALEVLLNSMENKEDICDLVCCSYQRLSSNDDLTNVCLTDGILASSQKLATLCYNQNMEIILGGIWGKLYRKSLIETYEIRFPVDIACYEDNVFNIEYYTKVHLAVTSSSIVYVYRENLNSVTFNLKKTVLNDFVFAMKKRNEYFRLAVAFDFDKFATNVVVQGGYLLRQFARQQMKHSDKLYYIDRMLSDCFVKNCIDKSSFGACTNNKEKVYMAIMKIKSSKVICLIFYIMDLLQKKNKA